MAYKFQRGTAILSGSITAEEGLDAGDSNITNVGDIALDSISSDGTTINIAAPLGQASAFTVKSGSTNFIQLATSAGASGLILGQGAIVSSDASLMFDLDGNNLHLYNSTGDAL